MTKAKHTAGPWNVEGCENRNGDLIIRDDNALHIAYATTDGTTYIDERVEVNEVDMYANARLIAAAPELLEALKLALEAAQQGVEDYSWEDAAIAAIAKAEGGEA